MLGERAVVLGGSMAGLLAARVLAEHYRTVVVVERDTLPTSPGTRRGVPQGRHVHLLWGRGASILDDFFPGFVGELRDAGAPYFGGDLSQVYISTGGHPLPGSGQFDDFRTVLPRRPFLEHLVRRRVWAMSNIEIRDGHDVVEPVAEGNNVTGAVIRSRDGGADEVVAADLVIDAMGRAGRTPALLESLGYERPAEEGLDVRLQYSSLPIRLPPGALQELAVVVGPVPGRPTGMGLFRNENDTTMFTALAMAGVEAPNTLGEMVSFITAFAPAHVVAAVGASEVVGEGAQHRMPATRWRRYDKMHRWPTGLLAIGDAICSLNPIYAQGMTVAALQAKVLQKSLRGGTNHLQQRYFRATTGPIGNAWQLATGADLSLPEIVGPRPLPVRAINGSVKRVQAAARTDSVVAHQLTRTVSLVAPPAGLMHPRIAARVAAASLKRARAATP